QGSNSRIPSLVGQASNRRYVPIRTNGLPEHLGANQNVLEPLAINLGNTGEPASAPGDTSPPTVAESSTNTQTSQQTAASPPAEEVNHAFPSSSMTGPQTTAGPAPMLPAEGTGQGAVEEPTTIPSRGTALVSVSDQGVQTDMENIKGPALVELTTRCDRLENLLGLLMVKTLTFVENVSQPSTTCASSASSTSGTTQTSLDVHPAGESSVSNDRCQECIELKRQISHLEQDHNIEQESHWEIRDNLTQMIEEKDRQTSERIGHLEKNLQNASADLQRVATELDKYKMRASYLQGKLRGQHRPRGNVTGARLFTKQNRHELRAFAAYIQRLTAEPRGAVSPPTVSSNPAVQNLRHKQQIEVESNTNTDSRRPHLHQQSDESRNMMLPHVNEKEVTFLLPNDEQSPRKQEQGTTSHTKQPRANTVTMTQQEALSNTDRRSNVLDNNTDRIKAKAGRNRKPQSRHVKLEVTQRQNYGLAILDDALST
ncbi:unnamed protein product, partial [Clonostachys solani]